MRSRHALLSGALVAAGLTAILMFGVPAARAQTDENVPAPPTPLVAGMVDLNRSSLEELKTLPITPALAQAIYDYRTYNDLFKSIFDLLKVPGMTPEIFVQIRSRVTVAPRFMAVEESAEDDRLEAIYDVVQRLLSQEGVSEGLVDEYVDMLRQPRNVNNMDYFALTAIQNVSPSDAVAILRARREKPFESTQELRRTDGLNYFGYRNLRDFVRFDEGPAGDRYKVSGDYQLRVYNTPYELDANDILVDQLAASSGSTGANVRNDRDVDDFEKNTLYGRLGIGQAHPYVTSKLRVRLGSDIKTGLLTHRNLGERKLDETLKWFGGVENRKVGPLSIKKAYLGNYRLAFGHGLVMDNTDFYQARRTGQGYNVRPIGVRGDISRSDESALKGGAFEASIGGLRATGFYSNDNKDAILNPDHSFNRYITMVPRVDNETMDEIQGFVTAAGAGHFLPMRDVMNEKIIGGNLKYNLWDGTYVGATAMEMKYKNRFFGNPDSVTAVDYFNPDPATLIIQKDQRFENRDVDMSTGYDSRRLGNFRDIIGAEFGAVRGNLSLQGEYGKLLTTPRSSFPSRAIHYGPEAYVASAYLQYENFNFYALYRDYDEGYDNPYNRAFSETNRYDQTLLGDEFRLWNPLFSYLAENDPQSKAERGFYFTTRYQVNRQFTINYLEYDNYYRKADNTQQQRVTLSVEYRPVFPVRFRVRQRYSTRDGKGADAVRNFEGWDSRYEARFFLSHYDRMEFLYSTTTVLFGPRPRLSGLEEGGVNPLGTRSIPTQALQAKLTHNFNSGLSTTLSSEVYDGFLFNFEDNEFVAFEGKGYRNWFLVRSRLSNQLSWRLKYTVDSRKPINGITTLAYPYTGSPTSTIQADNARQIDNSFRFQLDVTF